MARAQYTDILVNSEGHPIRGVVVKPETNVTVHPGAAGEAVFWAGETGPGTVTSVKSNAQGLIQVWLTEGRYDVAIPHFQVTKTIDVINQTTVASGGGGGGSGTVTQVNGVSPEGLGHVTLPGLSSTGELPPRAVTSREVALGSVTGNVAVNLAVGDVFKGAMTGSVALTTPTGYSGTSRRRIWEVELTGEHTVTFPFLTEWRFGGEPPSGPYQFYTDDGTHFYGVGVEGLPADVPRVTAVADKQTLLYNSATGKYEGSTPSAGLSAEAVKSLIAELGIPEFPGGIDLFPHSDAEGVVHWDEFTAEILTKALGRLQIVAAAVTKTETLAPIGDRRYRVTKSESGGIPVTVTLPLAFVTAGAILCFENASVGPIKLSSRFTAESEAVTTIEMQPGEVLTLYSDANALHWYIIGRSRVANDVTTPDINTAGKTSNQITKAYEAAFSPEKPPRDTSLLVDNTNHLLLEYDGTLKKWFKSAALTEIV